MIIKDDHIFRMTDDTGMLQHSKYSLPDPNHGYTTDDNARALIMALMLYKKYGEKKYLDLVYRYSSFLLNAQNEKGKFKNFMGYDRKWLEDEGSEDCFGRCLWAIGFALSGDFTPEGLNMLSWKFSIKLCPMRQGRKRHNNYLRDMVWFDAVGSTCFLGLFLYSFRNSKALLERLY